MGNTVVEQRNNVDDVAVLRNESHNVQSLMMSDINEIKSDTKFDELRQENESLKSELSTITLKLAADSKTHDLEMKYSQEEKARLQGANEKLESRIEDLASTLSSTEQIVALERKKAGEIQNDLQQRTKELLSSKAEFDDLKE